MGGGGQEAEVLVTIANNVDVEEVSMEEVDINADDSNNKKKDKDKKATKANKKDDLSNTKTNNNAATTSETLSFVFHDGELKTKLIFIVGVIAAIGNGLVYPFIAFIFSNLFTDIGSATANGLGPIKSIAYWLMGIGVYALIISTIQTTCFEICSYKGTLNLKKEWFYSLLRQDSSYFDVYNISGIANTLNPQSNKYRRGLGRKFGEGVQFFTTGVGGVAYALYAEWRVALLVLSFCPVIGFFAINVVKLNQTKSERSAQAYSKAGSIAYSTVSGIKTVLSLNACTKIITEYKKATQNAFLIAIRTLIKQGFVNGMMLGSFLIMYIILTLYGCYLIYRDVLSNGCDPSGGVTTNITCRSAGPDVFGAMLGIAFAAQGIGQVGTFLETFSTAKVAAGQALTSIRRIPGEGKSVSEEIIYHVEDDEKKDKKKKDNSNGNGDSNDGTGSVGSSGRNSIRSSSIALDESIETPKGRIKAILPPYEINSLSKNGLSPPQKDVKGNIQFNNVIFNYPTRPSHQILNGLSIQIKEGSTIAFVGPSGGGKSTIVKLLERFYDPINGTITLDGINIRDLNVKYLRGLLGYVGQEPQLFATTIAKNIEYGISKSSQSSSSGEEIQKQIEDAAKLANAHDFIMSLPDQYETHVGDKGSQLSGGQKQRIAIARVLVGNPKILLLDEATSALDSQSELIVQEALENIISDKQNKRTTIIIAHRLSTIRNADTIAVVMGGVIVETGTHDELMSKNDTYYKKLVDTQSKAMAEGNTGTNTSGMMKRNASINSSGGPPPSSLSLLTKSESQLGFDKVPIKFHESGAQPLIVFRNISFSYPTRPNKLILDRFKLKIYKGETIGLCGISGGGKSTVMGLIERFYDPNEGKVEYFGTDIQKINVKWYRDQIGYVGQEPILFDATIADNIAYGCDDDNAADNDNEDGSTPTTAKISREQIIEAAKQANAYDFIMNFPDNFDTMINGGSNTQLSGGQKQRIAIARAILKQPEILLLDEATSALDNESESIVQEALNKLMEDNNRTCIVIAHRLATIRNADRIAFIGDGRVKEIGSHDELMDKPKGFYKRLVEAQGRTATTILLDGMLSSPSSTKEKKKTTTKKKGSKQLDDDDEDNADEKNNNDDDGNDEKEELSAFNLARARKLASPDAFYLLAGSLGALMAGSVFPAWGLLFAETIDLLYVRIDACTDEFLNTSIYDTCEDYWSYESDRMQSESFTLSSYWAILVCVCVSGNILTFWGFGNASERMNRRVRNWTFHSLIRQEVSYFDQRSVGKITSELQEDATRIQTFTGDPIRSLLIALSSVLTGLILSFVYMWPFALLAVACIPLMGFATNLDMKRMNGEDEGVENVNDETTSPSGIAVETLLNMGTVSALTLEEERFNMFKEALDNSDEHYIRDGFHQGVLAGLSMFIQQWINALQMYWGGWLLFNYPNQYGFNDFLVSNFAILFSLFGLGAAFQDISDRKETEKSASRIFSLLDRVSSIDPLSKEGKILDTSGDMPMKSQHKLSIKRKSSTKKMTKQQERKSSLEDVDEKSFKNVNPDQDRPS